MRAYEMTFIVAPTLDAEGVTREIDAVKALITGHGGEVTAERAWGRRRLAYPIQDHSEGVYHILRFTMNQSGLVELNRHFKLNDEKFLRHLVILDEGTPMEYAHSSESEDYRDRGDRPGSRRPSGPPSRDADSRSEPESRPKAETPAPAPAAAGGDE